MKFQEWARQALSGNNIILDTETTGLGRDDEVIQLGIINIRGEILCDARVRPDMEVSPSATAIHGITQEALQHAPHIREIHGFLMGIFDAHDLIIAYNAPFDARMLAQTLRKNNLATPTNRWICAMRAYAEGGRWSKLTDVCEAEINVPAHSAVGDCLRTLALLKGAQE